MHDDEGTIMKLLDRRSLAAAAATVALLTTTACGGTETTASSSTALGPVSTTDTTASKTLDSDDSPTTDSAPNTEPVTETPVEEVPEATCAYLGTDETFGDMQVELVFTNPLGEVNGLEATYALLDGEGTRFYTGSAGGLDMVDIKFPAPNEQFRLLVDTAEALPETIDEATIGCSVLGFDESTDIGGYARATEADTCEVVGEDPSSGIQVEVTVTNPYEATATVQTWWALQTPGPITFATETEVVELVAAGETFKILPDYGANTPEWAEGSEVTCVVLGFWEH